MPDVLQQFVGQPLRRVRYYRTQGDANCDLNWPGFHDVGQGIELGFDAGHFFVTWDNAADEELSVHLGCMVDFLSAGIFEEVSDHEDWLEHVGQPLHAVYVLSNEAIVEIGGKQVFIVTAEVDRETLQIDGMADNLVVFFSRGGRDRFFAQYPDAQAE